MMQDQVIILMATYNGTKYLEKQIESIQKQTHKNWRLIVRDDNSKDETVSLIKYYEAKDERISYISTTCDFKGACANFSELYNWFKKNLEAKYLMFCDQDDIWLENKVSKSLANIRAVETYTKGPVLLYGNLKLIDEEGKFLNTKIKLNQNMKFNNVLVQNSAFGCTMMLNKNLIDSIPNIPVNAENHDYWISLVATAFGTCKFIEDELILYRQHSMNVTAQGSTLKKQIKKYIGNIEIEITSFARKLNMIELFNIDFGSKLSPSKKIVIDEFINVFNTKWRLLIPKVIIKHKIYRNKLLQNVGMLYLITFFKVKIMKIKNMQ